MAWLPFFTLAYFMLGISEAASYATPCCSGLSGHLRPNVVYPGSSAYNESLSTYWALQEQVMSPSCIVMPRSTEEVAAVLKALVSRSCKFAVRSGGHGSVPGISNIESGVTIDLRRLNFTKLSSDGRLVSVGAGQNWHGVYLPLYQAGLTIPGGRDSSIGVSGSTLGGALGYVGPSTGLGCDSVVEFEVVLADGNVVSATRSHNSDLWRALKGGGSNFGIVTKLVFQTRPLGDIWVGTAYYPVTALEGELQAFHDFTANPTYDTKASLMMSFAYAVDRGLLLANSYAYAEPLHMPSAFSPFYAIPNQLGNTTSITNVAAYSIDQDATSPSGFHQITFATTFTNSIQQLHDVWAEFERTTLKLGQASGTSLAVTFFPIVPSLIAASKARGGNVMGLEAPPEGLVMTVGSLSFTAAEYGVMSGLADGLLSGIIEAAKRNHVHHPYIDLNHAKGSQKPFLGYGAGNYAFLKSTSQKYDPRGVFQALMPGGFKL